MDPEFRGMKVLITGAAGVFGSELARGFASAGAILCLSDFREYALRALADELRLPPQRLLFHPTNLTQDESIHGLVELIRGAWGHPMWS
jgi:3-oxoacyl-[acyl-carrier protein] reductase